MYLNVHLQKDKVVCYPAKFDNSKLTLLSIYSQPIHLTRVKVKGLEVLVPLLPDA